MKKRMIKQKLMGIGLIAFGLWTTTIINDATGALFMGMLGCYLMFAKQCFVD